MQLNDINNFSPLDMMLRGGIGKNYFAKNAISVPQTPKSGFQGGSYDGQLKTRHKTYFGGQFGR